MAPMSAEELQKHPEYDHTIWHLKPEKKGKVAVANARGGPIDIAYEVHGKGDRHMVWVMGLGGMKYAWQRQTKDFAHTKGDLYSSLVTDNRGIGDSDKPRSRYSTTEMAKDLVEVVDHLGWVGKRELHVVGISMGGMIAQEIAMLIPERICTLSLVSTAAGVFRTTGFVENLWNRVNLFVPKAIDQQIEAVKKNLYTPAFLDAPDNLEPVKQSFPTNGDRFAANEIWKRSHPEYFQKTGFILQAIAAGWHYKSPEQLQQIAKTVGKNRIMVIHGTKDQMITFPHGVVLWRGLEKGEGKTGKENWLGIEEEADVWQEGEVEKHFIKGQGHVVPAEMREEFGQWLENLVERGIKLNGQEGVNKWIQYHDELVSEEGRSIPYLTLSNGKKNDTKLRIWIQDGQHGDEPAGDQGVLALLGKFAAEPHWAAKVLDRIDLTILPRYNADGVQYFQRQLASNYDPNRDHAILTRDQTRAIRRLQSAFDPHIFVDAHEYTSVGLLAQQYIRAQDLLVSANKNPNINPAIRALNEAFVTHVFAAAQSKGLRVGPYFTTSIANGTITIQEPDWHAQANHKGAGNYQSLTFLVETRGIRLGAQHFQRRVASHVVALETIINRAIDEFEHVYATIENGRIAFAKSRQDIVVLDEYRISSKRIPFFTADGTLANVTVRSQNSDPSTPILTRSRPRAYLFSAAYLPVAERLRVLGVVVSPLGSDFSGTVETLVVAKAELAKEKFEGVAATTIATRATTRDVRVPKGGFRVDTAQKNAGYAFALLEPEGVASVARYNVVPVEVGDEWPIFRVL